MTTDDERTVTRIVREMAEGAYVLAYQLVLYGHDGETCRILGRMEGDGTEYAVRTLKRARARYDARLADVRVTQANEVEDGET